MGKILILYDSSSGHTKEMAGYIKKGAESLYNNEVKILSVDDANTENIKWCDGIAVGSPTNMGILSWKMKKFWDEQLDGLWGKIDGKIGCAFSSSGGWGGGSEITCMSILTILMNFGFLVFGVTDYVADRFTLHYGAVVAGKPREKKEIESCIRLGERLSFWIHQYIDNSNKNEIRRLKEKGKLED